MSAEPIHALLEGKILYIEEDIIEYKFDEKKSIVGVYIGFLTLDKRNLYRLFVNQTGGKNPIVGIKPYEGKDVVIEVSIRDEKMKFIRIRK